MNKLIDLQPTLLGEVLELRPARAEDLAELYAVASDPEIWAQHPFRDRYKKDAFRTFFDASLRAKNALVAIDRKTGAFIGFSKFNEYDRAGSVIEIGGTFLARSHWGGAYNREMKVLMMQHAFKFVENVIFLVGLRNIRSQRAVENIGAKPNGSRPDNTGRQRTIYRVTRTDFEKEVTAGRFADMPIARSTARSVT